MENDKNLPKGEFRNTGKVKEYPRNINIPGINSKLHRPHLINRSQ